MSSPHALYRFRDADGQLLYVGITLDPSSRWKQHAHDKPWWTAVSTISVEPFPSRPEVLQAERDAIRAEKPLHNVVYNRPKMPAPSLERPQAGEIVGLRLKGGLTASGQVITDPDEDVLAIQGLIGYRTVDGSVFRTAWTNVRKMVAFPAPLDRYSVWALQSFTNPGLKLPKP